MILLALLAAIGGVLALGAEESALLTTLTVVTQGV